MSRDKVFPFGLLACQFLLGAWAHAQNIDGTLMMDPSPGAAMGADVLALRGKPMLVVEVRPMKAVQLASATAVSAKNPLSGRKSQQPFSDGQVIGAIAGREGLYCSPIRKGMVTSIGACLLDENDDGSFDASVTAAFHTFAVHGLAVNDRREVYGVNLSKAKRLPEPVAYKSVPYVDAPSAEARLMWESNSRKAAAGGAVKLRMWLDAGSGSTGTGVLAESDETLLPGGVGTVEVHGIRIDVLGFDGEGNMRARVVETKKGQLVGFRFVPGYRGMLVY
jgi:hypothetical protein